MTGRMLQDLNWLPAIWIALLILSAVISLHIGRHWHDNH